MKDVPEIDLLVLEYLRRKGYAGAAIALQRDSNIDEDTEMALSHRLDQKTGTIENLVHVAQAESLPEKYVFGYQKLSAWVDGSLDLYRGELKRVLYPVFIHCYLELIKMSRTQLANDLINKHKARLVETAAGPSQRRTSELKELQSVAVPQHLESNVLARAYRSKKQALRLCSYSYHLLLTFLQGARLWPIFNIMNSHLRIEAYDGAPSTAEEDALLDGEGEAQDPAAVAASSVPLQLSLLKGNLEDRLWELRQAAAAAATPRPNEPRKEGGGGEGGGEGGEGPKSKKQRVAEEKLQQQRQREQDKAVAEHKRVLAERREPGLKLPDLGEDALDAVLESMKGRQEVGPELLPSCCFFTMCNTRQAMCASTCSADATLLAAGFADASIRLFQVEQLASQQSASSTSHTQVDDDSRPRWGAEVTLRGHSAAVTSLDLNPDSRLLLSGSADGSVRLWSTELAANLVVWKGHLLPVWDVAACPTGYFLASASADRTAHLWCTDQLRPLRVFAGHDGDVDVVRWHPNCHYIATGSSDRSVRLWDVQTGGCVRVMPGLGAALTSIAFSPDGSTLAAATADGSIVIWDLGTARRVATLGGHHGAVWSLAYSHGEGNILASGSADCTVKYWGASSGKSGKDDGGGRHQAKGSDTAWKLLGTYYTKSTPVYSLQFTMQNLLVGSGALRIVRK